MLRGMHAAVAILVGVVAATATGLALSPALAFLGAALIAYVASHFLHRTLHAEPEPREGTGDAGETGGRQIPADVGPQLIEKLPVPLLLISQRGRLGYANLAAQGMLPRLTPGQHFAHIIRAPAFVEAVSATLRDGLERSFEFTSYEGNERHFEARVSMLAECEGFGPEAHAIVQVEDRTRTHRIEQLRSDFIANASHELRTPLASIIGYIETLQNHAREDPEARERFLAIMAREAHRMQRLVDDLMSLSRIEMNEHVRPVERLPLNRIACDCASVFQPLASQEGITLRVELDPDEADVIGDRDQLSQVFTNLIDNAMKYSAPGATVTIRSAPENPAHPGRVGVSVSDTGMGIPREKLHRLTERFFRVSVPQSRHKGGTGLGLAIVKHILNRHKGRIEISSVLGEGSTFTVWLPRATQLHIVPDEPPAVAPASRAAR
ncbi:ATP-binding protein [Rhodobacteraceae bacterium DSL-40]|uniref:sensor histidine kinase n=1 Tax=Amaricoccus sp. B4 TaxID=3368557 RepID=UPI000DAE96E8